MKRIIISSLLLCVLLPASAQRLTVEKNTVDCGKTAYQQPVTAEFRLRNKGLRKLKISHVETFCGCLKAEYPQGEIGMGERFTLKVTYNARQLGHFQKVISIESNGSKEPVLLTMKGVVLASIEDFSGTYPYEMGDLRVDNNNLEFDDVNKGERPSQVLHVMNVGNKVLQPNLLHLPPYLSAVVSPERLSPNRAGTITVSLNSDKLHDYGLTQTSVYLAKELGEKVSPSSEITVSTVLLPATASSASSSPRMQLSAERLDMAFDGKNKRSGEIIITNSGQATLHISSLQMFTGGLRVTLNRREIAPGQTAKLKVTAYRDELKSVRSRPRVLMITNDPHKQKVVISINAK